ncbi:MAG: TolC family protein [Bacteroidales bacterium]|nr:TolC family protein [Bacteroidales bacterium]
MIILASVLAIAAAQVDTVQTAQGQEETIAEITLEQALQIALSENIAVKVADKEIERAQYSKKGTYASLFPKIDASASIQRTIKKQVMYMGGDDNDEDGGGGGMSGMMSGVLAPVMYYIEELYKATNTPFVPYVAPPSTSDDSNGGGIEVGRLNTFSAGVSASMPIINFQLWESLKLSGNQVELAVEKARSSRLEMVTQVKQAYFQVLFAKEAAKVYKEVYENALANKEKIQMRYEAQKASELELARALTTLANAIPNMYDSENAVTLALWQLKAVMGVDLDLQIDTKGELHDYAEEMTILYGENELSLENNSSMRQLELQAAQLASAVRSSKYANLPSLSLGFAYQYSAMANDYNFSNYKWTPYSYVGLSLNIPIFAGGQRYHSIKAAQVQAEELDIQKLETERRLRISIRQNLNTMETAMRSFDAADAALEASRKSYDITLASYEIGGATLTDLNDAQLALTQAQLTAGQSIFNYLTAKASLEGALGNDFLETSENNE